MVIKQNNYMLGKIKDIAKNYTFQKIKINYYLDVFVNVILL
mgnify:CR=1 FL=1